MGGIFHNARAQWAYRLEYVKYSMEYMWNIPLWAMWGWNVGHFLQRLEYSNHIPWNICRIFYSMHIPWNICRILHCGVRGCPVEYLWNIPWNISGIFQFGQCRFGTLGICHSVWNIPIIFHGIYAEYCIPTIFHGI